MTFGQGCYSRGHSLGFATLARSRNNRNNYSRMLLPVICCQSRLAEMTEPPDPGVLAAGAEFPSRSISPPRRSAI